MATYSLQDVQVSLVGPGVNASLGAGAAVAKEGITVEFLEPKDNLLMGADGQGAHSLRATQAGRVTLRLLKTSPQNAVLQAAYDYQRSSSLFWGQNVLTVTNPVTGDDYPCTDVAFEQFPSVTWAEDANVNEWRFLAIAVDAMLGAGVAGLTSGD